MKGNRWFIASLAIGVLLSVLVLVNSAMSYVFITRRILVEQLRREMSSTVSSFEREARTWKASDTARAAAALQNLRISGERVAWAHLQSRDGRVVAHAGLPLEPVFSETQFRETLSARKPATAVRQLPSGEAVVEAFPVRLEGVGPARLEFAAWTGSARAAAWPVLRNTAINCSAALALLGAIALLAVRYRVWLRGRKLEHELEIARGVQEMLLTTSPDAVRNVKVAASCQPAAGVGGDLHDVFATPDGAVALVVGDVSGKGIPAALLMGVLHGAVRSSNWFASASAHEGATARLNRLLCERTAGARFASLFWGCYDPLQNRLRYINAGHCPPIVARRWQHVTEVGTLTEGGPVLGLLGSARYAQAEADVWPGDLLVLYSDGLVEAASADGEEFGELRLRRIIEECGTEDPETVRTRILKELREFAPGALHDDLTLMCVRFEGATEQVAHTVPVPVVVS